MFKNNIEFITLKKQGITNFADERNNLLKKTKAEWVFFVDSDEVITDKLREEILKRIQDDRFDGYYVYRKNYFLGKYIGSDRLIRLGRKNFGKWERAVHESWVIKGRVGMLTNRLVHNTAESLSDYITKINFYAKLHAKANILEGKRANLFKIVLYPPLKFVQSLIMGRGVVFSILQAFHSFLAWSEMYMNHG